MVSHHPFPEKNDAALSAACKAPGAQLERKAYGHAASLKETVVWKGCLIAYRKAACKRNCLPGGVGQCRNGAGRGRFARPETLRIAPIMLFFRGNICETTPTHAHNSHRQRRLFGVLTCAGIAPSGA